MTAHMKCSRPISDRTVVPCWLTAWACAGLLALHVSDVSAAEPRRVLLLQAFSHAYSPWSDIAASLRAELIQESPEPIDIYEVSLDTDRRQGSQDEGAIVEYL